MTTNFCAKCGTRIPEGSNFCPRCGAAIVAAPPNLETIPAFTPPPAAPAPHKMPRSAWLVGVPLAMLAMGLLIWALLAGLPFGRGDRQARKEAAKRYETVSEAAPPKGSNSRELVVAGERAPTVERREPVAAPKRETPAVSETDAAATLRAYITSRADYGVSSDCLEVTPVEYKNVGYTLTAADRCDNTSLGRWRIDARTREIFRQHEDGRYLRP